MRAYKRTFNAPRLKSQIWTMGFRCFVSFVNSTNQKFPLTFSQSFLCTRISYSIIWSGLFPKLHVRLLNVPFAGYIVCDKWSFVLYLYGIPSCSNCVRISLNFFTSVPIQRLSEFKKLNIKIPSFLSFFVNVHSYFLQAQLSKPTSFLLYYTFYKMLWQVFFKHTLVSFKICLESTF